MELPTYEYACTSCGQHIEVVQSMSDEPLRKCGACGGQLRKVFSPIGIVFKGSGFYRTDSRSAGGNGRSGGPDKTAAGSDSSSGEKGGDKGGDKSAASTSSESTSSSSEKSA